MEGETSFLEIQEFILSLMPLFCVATVFLISSPTCHRRRESRLWSPCLLTSLHGVGMYKVFVKCCHILWSVVIFWLWWPLLFYYRCCRRGYTYSTLLMRNKIWFAKDYTQLCAITWMSPTKGLSVCAITWMSPAEGLSVHTNDWTVNPLLCSVV
jgi:hypothetical protein